MAGDDLDDQLEYSFDNVSDGEQVPEPLEPLSGEEEEFDVDSTPKAKKRSRSEDSDNESSTVRAKALAKKSKKVKGSAKQTEKLKSKKEQKVANIAESKTRLAQMNPSLIADYVAAKIRRRNPDLSSIELDELSIPEHQIADSSDYTGSRDLDDFPAFMQKFFPSQLKADQKDDLILILAISAIRVCDITRALKSVPGGAIKLIKKNKLSVDKHSLQLRKSAVAVSTAGRLNRLIDEGIFSLDRVHSVVVDSSFLDSKSNSVWDLSDSTPILKRVIKDSDVKIYLF